MSEHWQREQWQRRYGSRLRVGENCALPGDLRVEIEDGGLVVFGDRVEVRPGTTIQAGRGAAVVVGDDAVIGENTFLSAMAGIRVGCGAAVGDGCEIRDHSHCTAAPIVIESGAVLSCQATVTAGVRIGQNSVVGANSVVSQSVGPNRIVDGVPARAVRMFDGPLRATDPRHVIRVAWFGARGRGRGYVRRLELNWRTAWPYLGFDISRRETDDSGTVRDILRLAREWHAAGGRADLAFFGCGSNDVRRSPQTGVREYADAYRDAVRLLADASQRLVCVGEPPFGWAAEPDVTPLNSELADWNAAGAAIAAEEGVDFVDPWAAFTTTASQLSGWAGAGESAEVQSEETLWAGDGRLSELGDALMLRLVDDHVREHQLIEGMTTYQRLGRATAAGAYRDLFADVRREPASRERVPA